MRHFWYIFKQFHDSYLENEKNRFSALVSVGCLWLGSAVISIFLYRALTTETIAEFFNAQLVAVTVFIGILSGILSNLFNIVEANLSKDVPDYRMKAYRTLYSSVSFAMLLSLINSAFNLLSYIVGRQPYDMWQLTKSCAMWWDLQMWVGFVVTASFVMILGVLFRVLVKCNVLIYPKLR